MKRQFRVLPLLACAAIAAQWSLSTSVVAQVVFGDWESGAREGWIDWNGGSPTATVDLPKYAFNSIGATHGSGSIQYNSPGGYTQWLAIKLQLDANDPLANGVMDYRPGFLASTKMAFDLTIVASEQTAGNDFANLGVFLNSNTWGFNRIGDPNNGNAPESVTNFTGYNGGNAFNPSLVVGTATSTWTYDIGFLHDGNTDNGEIVTGDYIEFIFEEFSNNSTVLHLDNVRFFTPVTPVAGDYNSNGIVDAGDYVVWRDHLDQTFQLPNEGPGQSPGVVDQADYTYWIARFGATTGSGASPGAAAPEPATWLLGLLAVCGQIALHRRRGNE